MKNLEEKPKILIIDDEQEGRKLIKSILKNASYQTCEAKDGKEGLEMLRDEKFDLVLLDIRMPEMDGYQVCHEIRNDPVLKRIPVIMLTVMDETLDRVRGHRLGIDDYITKPYDGEELLTRINSVLSRRNLYEKISMTDPLTELYNVNFFQEQFKTYFHLAQRNDRMFSLALIDINKFKFINDTYGHLAGDHVLKKVANIMTDTLRKTDIITRYGGDEFTILFPGLNAKQAEIAMNKLKKAISQETFYDQKSGKCIDVSVSLGIASYSKRYSETEQMFESADKKMYKDKTSSQKKD